MPIHEKLRAVKKVLVKKESVASVARELGIARKTLYKWIELYKSAAKRNKKTALAPKYLKGKDHPKALKTEITWKLVRLIKKQPNLTVSEYAQKINCGRHFVYSKLKALNLTREDSRLAFSRLYSFPGIFSVDVKLKIVRTAFAKQESVSMLAKRYSVSRKSIYKWLNDFNSGRKLKCGFVSGDAHPRAYKKEVVDSILKGVIRNPELAINSLAKSLGLGVHGVFNVLSRFGLTLKEQRLAYSQIHSRESELPRISSLPAKTFLSDLTPNLLPAPPPEKLSFNLFSKTSIAFFGAFLILVAIISLIGSCGAAGAACNVGVGHVFASVALLMGSIFFLYSIKYYVTLAAVLSYNHDTGSDTGDKKPGSGILASILGFAAPDAKRTLKSFGLESNLDNVGLKAKPFVSVQIPFYNEKNVARRAIEAAINFKYPNYEIIICDDSSDETTAIIRDLQKSYLFKGEELQIKENTHEGWTMAIVEVKPGIFLKHIHRSKREGFKGKALELALGLINPKTEYISVFDADFVPYPDTLELFLKYFQVSGESPLGGNIAAVQGYQWHVLNKSENWITRGVRSEYAGSYVIERSGAEIYGGLKQISGSVYMIKRAPLEQIGWGSSITEDFELTLKLYAAGYKVLYTPYIQAPSECVSTVKRIIRQRMRWAEGHSFNVKRMFTRLMFGGRDENGNIVRSPLTLPEKVEFLFLTPYYLQAFFFLVGTLAWMFAEVIFATRLSFWTEVWGWSLVLTNMLSLPLVNAVGLFMEESESRDYSGLASFILLSYLLVPFQAYASIKGLLEDAEGPWFRTPKTGRITDIFSRGKFYRFIQGILPGTANSAAFKMPESPYLNLNSANNRFESHAVPHKRAKGAAYVSKAVLAMVLSVSMMTVNLAPYFSGGLPVGQIGRTLLSSKEISLSRTENSNKAGKNPEFSLNIDKSVFENSKNKKPVSFLPFNIKNASAKGTEVNARLLNSEGEEAGGEVAVVKEADDKYKLSLGNIRFFTPGKYTLETKVKSGGKTYTSYQDFNWGVLAINTNKRVYVPNETVLFSFGVLDDKGKTVCDAELRMIVTAPNGENIELSSKNGNIQKSGQCSANSITNSADYSASLNLGGSVGVYKLLLEAANGNGLKSVSDEFKVAESPEAFTIERISYPTRIFPPAEYPVRIKITANKDYKGIVSEELPYSFEVGSISGGGKTSHSTFNLPFNKTETQKITWNADFKKGNSYELSYKLKFPPASPEFYLAGPVKIGDFSEAGVWQIAADVNTQIRQEINIIDTTITGSTASNSDAIVQLDTTKYNGTVTYYFEAVISGAASNTGTVTLRRSGTSTDDATLTGRTDSTLTRTRSTAFTPPAGQTAYVVRNNADGTRSQTIKAARIIVIQNTTSLTSSQTQIEIGNHETGKTNTTDSALTAPKYWKYTSANWDGTLTAYAEATYKNTPAAAPVVQAVGTAQGGTAAITVGWPSHTTGDVALLFVESTGGQAASLSTANGFAAVTNSPQATGTTTNGTRLTVFWARATSGSMASPVVGDSGNHTYGQIVTFRGVESSGNPWDITGGGVKASASTTTTWTSVDTTVSNTLVVFAAARDVTGTGAMFSSFAGGNVSGHTEVAGTDAGTISGNGGGLVVNTGTLAAAGATGAPTATVTSSINAMMTIALKPPQGTTTIKLQEDSDGAFGSWSDKATIVSAGTAESATRVRTSFTPTAGRNYRIVSSVSTASISNNIYNAKIIVDQSAGSSVTVDTSSSSVDSAGSDNNLTWTHTAATSATAIVVGVGTRVAQVSSVTYGGQSLSLIRQDRPGTDVTTSLWFLASPPTGANSVSVTINTNQQILAGATTLIGASNYHNATGDSDSSNLSDLASSQVTSATGEIVIDVFNAQTNVSGLTVNGDIQQTHAWEQNTPDQRSAGSTATGATTVSMGWTWSLGQAYAHTAASFYGTSGSITKLEPQYLLLNTASTTTGSVLNYSSLWDSSEWSGVTNTYYHAQDGRGASANARIVDRDNSNTVVTNSSVTGANQQISSALTMPTTGHNLDTWIVAAGTSVDASRILVAVSVDVVPENPLMLLMLSPFLAYAVMAMRKKRYADLS